MTRPDKDIIIKALEEYEQKIKNDIANKEKDLSDVKTTYYLAHIDKDFKEFINDKEHRNIELPYELYDRRDELEKEIRLLKYRLERYEKFKQQMLSELND